MSEKKNIARAAGVLGFATILSRIMGMVRDMAVSRLFGAGFATDAFFAAFLIPNMLRRFFAEGALTSAFVPIFSEWYTKKGADEARHLARVCFTLLVMVMAGVTLCGCLFAPQIVQLMFPGFSHHAPLVIADGSVITKTGLTVFLTRIMFPYIFFISIVALCMGILNTMRHFFTPAISTVFLNLAMIIAAVFMHHLFKVPVTALAVGVLIGGLLQLLLQLPTLYRMGFPLGFSADFRHPAVRRIALLMGPSVFGVGVYYLNLTVGNILASLLPQGSVSYLYYAQRLFEFPQGVFTVAVAQAVLPAMSRQAAAGELGELRESLGFGLRITLFVTIPATAGLIVCATPIFSLLFMGGEFDYRKGVNCASALACYAVGLTLVAMVRVLVPAFYALKDTKTPVFTAFIAFIANFIFSVLLMKPLLHDGLALASSLSALINMLLLGWFLRKKLGSLDGRRLLVTAVKALLASVPMAAGVSWGLRFADWSVTEGRTEKSMLLGGMVVVAMASYLLVAHMLKCGEVREVAALVRKKVDK